jgi:hypothetical protein
LLRLVHFVVAKVWPYPDVFSHLVMFPFLLRLQWLKVSGFVRRLFVVPLSNPHPKGFHPIRVSRSSYLRENRRRVM